MPPTTVGRMASKFPPPRRKKPDDYVTDSGKRIPPRPRKVTRPQALVEYFDGHWRDMTADPRARDLRQLRVLENRGACYRYIKTHFADTPDPQVRQWIDIFVSQVFRGDLRIKEGQSAWQLFTGTWGKYHNTTSREDEYAAYRAKQASE